MSRSSVRLHPAPTKTQPEDETMRAPILVILIIALILSVAACQGDAGSAGEQGITGEQGVPG